MVQYRILQIRSHLCPFLKYLPVSLVDVSVDVAVAEIDGVVAVENLKVFVAIWDDVSIVVEDIGVIVWIDVVCTEVNVCIDVTDVIEEKVDAQDIPILSFIWQIIGYKLTLCSLRAFMCVWLQELMSIWTSVISFFIW